MSDNATFQVGTERTQFDLTFRGVQSACVMCLTCQDICAIPYLGKDGGTAKRRALHMQRPRFGCPASCSEMGRYADPRASTASRMLILMRKGKSCLGAALPPLTPEECLEQVCPQHSWRNAPQWPHAIFGRCTGHATEDGRSPGARRRRKRSEASRSILAANSLGGRASEDIREQCENPASKIQRFNTCAQTLGWLSTIKVRLSHLVAAARVSKARGASLTQPSTVWRTT